LVFEPVESLEALNRRFWQWLEQEYHQREHAALAGESPAGRFRRLGQGLRLLCGEEPLDRWFGMRIKRRVRKDATFSLEGRYWEVPPFLRGQEVTVHYDPVGFTRVEIEHQGRMLGVVYPCNKNRNAQLTSTHHEYDQSF
jgi:hypothetical protein